jgi:hypothetical protein
VIAAPEIESRAGDSIPAISSSRSSANIPSGTPPLRLLARFKPFVLSPRFF